MNLSKQFLLIELKRNMFYKLQSVMSFKFNIIQNIYDVTRLIQFKEDHYKRIDDVKFRRRLNASIIAKFETRTIIIKTMNITTISTFINKNTSRSITWNSNQFRSSNSRNLEIRSKTSNFDSIKKQLMRENKCFNFDESEHLSKNCSKSKKIRIAEISTNENNSRKK
jgi:hypothetical protein